MPNPLRECATPLLTAALLTTTLACSSNDDVGPQVGCDDGNPCTVDSLGPADECLHEPVACPPGEACSTDTGACEGLCPCWDAIQEAIAYYNGLVLPGHEIPSAPPWEPGLDSLSNLSCNWEGDLLIIGTDQLNGTDPHAGEGYGSFDSIDLQVVSSSEGGFGCNVVVNLRYETATVREAAFDQSGLSEAEHEECQALQCTGS